MVVSYRSESCYYFVYRQCIRYTIPVDYDRMQLYFGSTEGFSLTWLKLVLTGSCRPVRRVLAAS